MEKMISSLKEKGCRITPQRLAVLKILAESKNHPSAEGIYQHVKTDFPTTSLATVYKTITLLKDLGELLELGFADWGSRYDGNKPYPHPHVVCVECGKIVDPEFSSTKDMAAEMEQNTGFRITHHRMDFFGICPVCRRDGK